MFVPHASVEVCVLLAQRRGHRAHPWRYCVRRSRVTRGFRSKPLTHLTDRVVSPDNVLVGGSLMAGRWDVARLVGVIWA